MKGSERKIYKDYPFWVWVNAWFIAPLLIILFTVITGTIPNQSMHDGAITLMGILLVSFIFSLPSLIFCGFCWFLLIRISLTDFQLKCLLCFFAIGSVIATLYFYTESERVIFNGLTLAYLTAIAIASFWVKVRPNK